MQRRVRNIPNDNELGAKTQPVEQHLQILNFTAEGSLPKYRRYDRPIILFASISKRSPYFVKKAEIFLWLTGVREHFSLTSFLCFLGDFVPLGLKGRFPALSVDESEVSLLSTLRAADRKSRSNETLAFSVVEPLLSAFPELPFASHATRSAAVSDRELLETSLLSGTSPGSSKSSCFLKQNFKSPVLEILLFQS